MTQWVISYTYIEYYINFEIDARKRNSFLLFFCYISKEKKLWILLSILYLKSSIYVIYLIISVLKIFDIIQFLFCHK